MPAPRKPTIRDVAKEAGVAISTISRYLNQSGYVDTETGLRIASAVQSLNYMPTRAAQTLKTRRSRQIMLVVPDIGNPFYSEMAKVVQASARDRGYALVLYNTNESTSEEIEAIRTADATQSDGIILCSIHVRDEVVQSLVSTGTPAILANSYEHCPFDTVHGVRGAGTLVSMRHLLELGHRRIAFAGGPADAETAVRRKFGYHQALTEAGISLDETLCFEMGFSEQAGYKAGKYFSSLRRLPTAICCANDLIALGVLEALTESGLQVPEQISVTGMDNIPFTHLSRPPLTTVTNDSTEFGRHVSRLLFERLEGYLGPPREVLVERRLVIRSSTAQCVKDLAVSQHAGMGTDT